MSINKRYTTIGCRDSKKVGNLCTRQMSWQSSVLTCNLILFTKYIHASLFDNINLWTRAIIRKKSILCTLGTYLCNLKQKRNRNFQREYNIFICVNCTAIITLKKKFIYLFKLMSNKTLIKFLYILGKYLSIVNQHIHNYMK